MRPRRRSRNWDRASRRALYSISKWRIWIGWNSYSTARVFAGADLQMRANLLRFSTWSRVNQLLQDVQKRISLNMAQIDGKTYNAEKDEAIAAIQKAQAELEALKKAPVPGAEAQRCWRNLPMGWIGSAS